MSGIDSDLIRGHIDTIILKALFEGDKYGYEICKEVEERSGGLYELKQPTLYSCLKRLESQKLITSYWTDSEIGGKRHYYKLTELGQETCKNNQDEWNRSRVIIDSLISNGEKPTFIIAPKENDTHYSKLQEQIENLQKQLDDANKAKQDAEDAKLMAEKAKDQAEKERLEAENKKLEAEKQALEKIQELQNAQSYIEQNKLNANENVESSEDQLVDQEKIVLDSQDNSQADFDQDFIPWSFENVESKENVEHEIYSNDDHFEEKVDSSESNEQPEVIQPSVKIVQLSDNFIATVASNGEILSVEKVNENADENTQETSVFQEAETSMENNEELEDQSPAQISVFENDENELVFDEDNQDINAQENQDVENVDDQDVAIMQEPEDDVDIMQLLGHGIVEQESQTKNIIAEDQEEINNAIVQNSSPFVFDQDLFADDGAQNFFDASSNEKQEEYLSPIISIAGKKQEEKSDDVFNFEEFRAKKLEPEEMNENAIIEDSSNDQDEDEDGPQTAKEIENVDISAPVYHDFGAISRSFEEADLTKDDPDAIYQNPDKEQSEISLFDDDILENTSYEPSFENSQEKNVNEEKEIPHQFDLFDEQKQDDEQIDQTETQKVIPSFYNSTDGYENLKANYTDEEYKEKLSSLLNYQSREKNSIDESYRMLTSPKDFKELKEEFESEGIVVKPHNKMVKESKSTLSYVQTTKLGIVNAWTSFGIVSFFTLLTFLIMNNYKSSFSSFDFSAKYFFIGLGILLVVPVIYSILYFLNPYKKKTAKYASRIHLLFALLLTVQLLIITYCVNLQLGFYSFRQENYNHLYWIVPAILSLYPIVDAVMHGIFFRSKNFHV